MPFATIPEAIEAIRRGQMVVLLDDEDRENEGDLVMAAEFADERAIAFMATKACGLICLAMDGSMLERLGLPMMTTVNRSRLGTAFTVSIEAAEGVTTGISAADRARTIQAATAADAGVRSVVSPGHIFPLRAQDGGVLVRTGQTEGSVDLARLAGCRPAAVICEIMKPDGTMARRPDLEIYCRDHGLLMVTVADLIAWRERRESLVELVAEGLLETPYGLLRATTWRSTVHPEHHLALAFGQRLAPGAEVADPVLVRVHKEQVLTDVLVGGPSALDPSLRLMAEAGEGLLLFIRDGDGEHLSRQLVSHGGRTVLPLPTLRTGMDPREYGIGAQILRHLGVRKMRLITGSDRPIAALAGFGLEIVDRLHPATVDGPASGGD